MILFIVTCSSNSQRFSTSSRINYTKWYITWLVWHSDKGKKKWISFIKDTKMKLFILCFDTKIRKLTLLAQNRRDIWGLSDCNGTRNGWVFVYELNGCGFESRCNHLNLRYRACFELGVPWHSGKYRVWIHSETRTWHDKNIQSKFSCFIQSFFISLFIHLLS